MKTIILPLLLLLFSFSVTAQKKILDHADFDIWNTIQDESISPDGKFVMYSLEKGEKDSFLKIKSGKGQHILESERAKKGMFSYDSKFAFFSITAWKDSVLEMKRRKVKKNDLPKDTLGIFDLDKKSLIKIPNIKSYKIPKKWSGIVAYQLEAEKVEKKEGEEKKERQKENNKENGFRLVVHNLETSQQDTFQYVTDYLFAEEGEKLAFTTTGDKDGNKAGVFVHDFKKKETNAIFDSKGKFKHIAFSKKGEQLGFLANLDTTKAQIPPYELYYWKEGVDKAQMLVKSQDEVLANDYIISEHGEVSFSEDGNKLFFGTATKPILQDTSLLEEEIVNVEVWTYDEPRLYTVQELQVENDKKKSFQAVIHLNGGNKIVQLANHEVSKTELGDEGNAEIAMIFDSKPYELQAQWEGWPAAKDVYVINTKTGDRSLALKKLRGRVHLSPKAQYVFGYDLVDSTWVTHHISSQKTTKLTKGKNFFNERNDSPNFPRGYGDLGWTENDGQLLLYDRYDIWQFDPQNPSSGKRLTKGREAKIVYRYVKLDPEERFIEPNAKLLLRAFDEKDKSTAYHEMDLKSGKMILLLEGDFALSNPKKSLLSDKVIFTKQTFEQFPDLLYADLSFKSENQISNANPQQSEYNWGKAKLVSWRSLDGISLNGILVTPEDFDPNKKYPMIVNFYERSSDRLHRHNAPSPGRSTINYSFYTSRGYIIFNPDVVYRIGYPGESAFNCVIPGVTYLIEKGFVDEENIGVQGHSWGGYQIAYLVTKTDIFKCAEAGAPVPNMISAYGGIRWWTGLSRQFQYEHTQSRIGGTPWEYPMRYIENSPIFFVDKINTPLLIMHNDADGHVPWYQGIEFFVSLRRLGKPSWFLNYNGEPHWPLKRHNREDFNIRMQQFFDHYLKAAPKPKWMESGVPAIEKGIRQGYELSDEQ